jgi:hypothetical protein
MQRQELKTMISKEQVHLNFLNPIHQKENKIYKMHNSKIYLLYVVIQLNVIHQKLILVNILQIIQMNNKLH